MLVDNLRGDKSINTFLETIELRPCIRREKKRIANLFSVLLLVLALE